MKTPARSHLFSAVAGAAIVVLMGAALRNSEAASNDSAAARLQRLEDRAEIMELLTAYGATLDRRDFAAFGQLFAEDAEYGGGRSPTRGRAAIQAQLERTIISNPSNLPGPNRHVFFNPSIKIDGDRATAHSLGAYTVPQVGTQATQLVFFTAYDDMLVRKNGRWLFQRRAMGGAP
jgi:hypothetical protein